MSSRRASSRQSASLSRVNDQQITDLLARLQQILSEIHNPRRGSSHKVSASRVLRETCDYIRSLQREVGDLSDQLSYLLATNDVERDEAAVIRRLLMRD